MTQKYSLVLFLLPLPLFRYASSEKIHWDFKTIYNKTKEKNFNKNPTMKKKKKKQPLY